MHSEAASKSAPSCFASCVAETLSPGSGRHVSPTSALRVQEGKGGAQSSEAVEKERNQLALALERLADVQKELASGQNNLMQGKSAHVTEILSVRWNGCAFVVPVDAPGVPSQWGGSPAAACTFVLTTATCSKCQRGRAFLPDDTLTVALLRRSAAACRAAAATGGPRQSACQQCTTCPILVWGCCPIIVTVTLCVPCTPCPLLQQQSGGCGQSSCPVPF